MKVIPILYFLFSINIGLYSQQFTALPVPSKLIEQKSKTDLIKTNINDPTNSSIHVEYPMQDYYFLPNLKDNSLPPSFAPDITPPSNPSNLIVHTSSIFSVYLEFTASVDAESGINYYAFAIGTAPGLSNIRYWQSLGTNTTTQSFSLNSLGIVEGSVFYFSVYAVNGGGLYSSNISSAPVTMNWENYGDTSNVLTIQYAPQGYDVDGTTIIAGWNAAQIAKYNHFISRMLPIIKSIYGPPSRSNVITLVRNLYYSGSNIYFPNNNQIHKDDSFYPQLLTHELIHAYRDDVILAMDANWNYSPKLSGFEESFAQGASYECMNRYVQLYPTDTVVNPASLWGSSMDWDYDFRNVSNITTEDFWSDYAGMGIHWERYELGAAAMRKMQLEDSMFYKKFNTAYYSYLNAHHSATPTRNLMVSLIASVLPSVEGKPTTDWIGRQRIFDCTIVPGRKGWVRTQHYPWSEYIIFQTLHYYETFSNGSDWAYYSNAAQSWVYYNLNGSAGSSAISNYSGSIIRQKNLVISNNPGGFGYDVVNFSTDNDLSPWPGGDTADYILNMNQLSLYKLHFTFDTTNVNVHRVIGNQLRNPTGIYGGILNSHGGQISVDHEGYPVEPALNISNGAFWGNRQWASVHNNLTGGTDTKAGKVTFRYTDSLGNVYRTFRNIDWGSWAGNQVFLLDVNDMDACSSSEIFNNNMDDDCDGLTDEASPVTLNLKFFIEGFYLGNGIMTPVLFNNSLSIDQTICDSVTVELHQSIPPYNLVQSIKGIFKTNGSGTFIFPQSTDNNSYYLVVKHRNAIETWSSSPLLFSSSSINYNFSDAVAKSYGNNLKNLGDGNFAIWSGDISSAVFGVGFQDGIIESQDYSDMENAVSVVLQGYTSEDISGDGVVESQDYSIEENNVYGVAGIVRP